MVTTPTAEPKACDSEPAPRSEVARPGSRILSSPYYELIVVLVFLAGLALLLGSTLWLTGGVFAYTIDDAYIHLALAENIAQGHYGLNLTEPSSPSSTVIWPFLLAPLSGLEQFELVPLVLNILFMVGALITLSHAVRAWLGPLLAPRYVLTLLFLLALSCNFWGLPLSGMEHSAQLLLTTWVAIGLIDLVENGRASPLFLTGLMLGPLVRFENLSLLVMGVVVLVLTRHRRQAVLVLTVVGIMLASYVWLMVSQGLPIIPSSVLVKSEVIAAEGFREMLAEAGENALEGLTKTRILPLVVMALMLAAAIRSRRRPKSLRQDRLYLLFLGGIVAAHLVAGKHGNQGRYEAYLLLAGLIILIWTFRARLVSLIQQHPRRAVLVLVVASLVVGKSQVEGTITAPMNARSTYCVNGEMHRFTVDYWHDSVGVNDIGWVSFRNPNYVLDLWGLGSESARVKRRDAQDMAWAVQLAEGRDVALFMIFQGWFTDLGPLPASWERIASLHGPGRMPGVVTTVVFILADPARRPELMTALEAFGSTLPEGVSLEITHSGSTFESP